MADLIDRQAVLALAKDIYVPMGDGRVYRTRSIDPQEVRELPAVQPDHTADVSKKVADEDCISRQAAVELAMKYCPDDDGAVQCEGDIRGLLDELENLPSVQPEQRWIPVTERLPENDNEVLITVWDAEDDYVEVYKGFYQGHEWWTQWCHGCAKIKDEPCGENIVIAWMPLPEPYRGGGKE